MSKHQAAAAEGVCDRVVAGGGVVRECGSDSGGRVCVDFLHLE